MHKKMSSCEMLLRIRRDSCSNSGRNHQSSSLRSLLPLLEHRRRIHTLKKKKEKRREDPASSLISRCGCRFLLERSSRIALPQQTTQQRSSLRPCILLLERRIAAIEKMTEEQQPLRSRLFLLERGIGALKKIAEQPPSSHRYLLLLLLLLSHRLEHRIPPLHKIAESPVFLHKTRQCQENGGGTETLQVGLQ